MAVKTQRKFLPTLIAIALGLGALWVLIPDEIIPAPGRNRDNRLLELKVTFEPSPRRNPIKVGYTVGGGGVQSYPARDSPWTRRITVPKGIGVVLFAEQPDIAMLECGIFEITDTGPVSLIWDVTDSHDPYPHTVVCEVRR